MTQRQVAQRDWDRLADWSGTLTWRVAQSRRCLWLSAFYPAVSLLLPSSLAFARVAAILPLKQVKIGCSVSVSSSWSWSSGPTAAADWPGVSSWRPASWASTYKRVGADRDCQLPRRSRRQACRNNQWNAWVGAQASFACLASQEKCRPLDLVAAKVERPTGSDGFGVNQAIDELVCLYLRMIVARSPHRACRSRVGGDGAEIWTWMAAVPGSALMAFLAPLEIWPLPF